MFQIYVTVGSCTYRNSLRTICAKFEVYRGYGCLWSNFFFFLRSIFGIKVKHVKMHLNCSENNEELLPLGGTAPWTLFWSLFLFSQKIKQLWIKHQIDLIKCSKECKTFYCNEVSKISGIYRKLLILTLIYVYVQSHKTVSSKLYDWYIRYFNTDYPMYKGTQKSQVYFSRGHGCEVAVQNVWKSIFSIFDP